MITFRLHLHTTMNWDTKENNSNNKYNVTYLILTNFRAYLISRKYGSRISRVLIFGLQGKLEQKCTKFRDFLSGLFS